MSEKLLTYIKNVKKASPIITIGNLYYRTFYKNERDANEMYLRILPLVKDAIKSGGRNSQKAKEGLAALLALAPTGAKARNFKRKFIDASDGWQKLPADPKNISYGFWY